MTAAIKANIEQLKIQRGIARFDMEKLKKDAGENPSQQASAYIEACEDKIAEYSESIQELEAKLA